MSRVGEKTFLKNRSDSPEGREKILTFWIGSDFEVNRERPHFGTRIHGRNEEQFMWRIIAAAESA